MTFCEIDSDGTCKNQLLLWPWSWFKVTRSSRWSEYSDFSKPVCLLLKVNNTDAISPFPCFIISWTTVTDLSDYTWFKVKSRHCLVECIFFSSETNWSDKLTKCGTTLTLTCWVRRAWKAKFKSFCKCMTMCITCKC